MENSIKNYGDIVKRILAIIKLSEEKKNKLDPLELKENYSAHFVYILYYDIDVYLASEFRDLIDAERTFNIMHDESPLVYLDKTRELLTLCEENSDPNYDNYVYYSDIIQIISESYGKSAFLLTEYKGYYIIRDRFNKWLWLMRKLNLLPDERKMSDADRKKETKKYLFQNHEQYDRLQRIFEKLNDKNELLSLDQISAFKLNLSNKKHSDIILLGLNGDLKLDYLRELKFLYTNEEYENLLAELSEWQIFSKEELDNLHQIEAKSTVVLEGKDIFDKLLRFFCNQENKIIDANAFRCLKPAIGEENLKNLVNTLHILGIISENIYEEYIALDNKEPTRK